MLHLKFYILSKFSFSCLSSQILIYRLARDINATVCLFRLAVSLFFANTNRSDRNIFHVMFRFLPFCTGFAFIYFIIRKYKLVVISIFTQSDFIWYKYTSIGFYPPLK